MSQAITWFIAEIAEYFHTDLTHIPVIGDSLRDVESAWAVQAQPILVLTGYGKKTLSQLPGLIKFPFLKIYKRQCRIYLGKISCY